MPQDPSDIGLEPDATESIAVPGLAAAALTGATPQVAENGNDSAMSAPVDTADEIPAAQISTERRPLRSPDGLDLAASAEALARVALAQDDPVAALDEGMDALAEVLADRDLARRQDETARRLEAGRDADFHQAYRHARWHRVGELIDLGYNLDQAVAIADANEAEIRARAAATGGAADEIIYRYAVMHGYRPQRPPVPPRTQPTPQPSALERLAAMSDEEFAQATRGERWQRLHRPS